MLRTSIPHLSHLFSTPVSIDRAGLSSVGVFTIALEICAGRTAFVTMVAMKSMRAALKLAMRVTTVNKILLKKRISNNLKKKTPKGNGQGQRYVVKHF